jgi:hypothetical protein
MFLISHRTYNKHNGIWWLQPLSHVEVLEWNSMGRSYADDPCGFAGCSNISISDRMFVSSTSQLLFPSQETLRSLPLFADCNKTQTSLTLSSTSPNHTKPRYMYTPCTNSQSIICYTLPLKMVANLYNNTTLHHQGHKNRHGTST